MRSIGTSGLTRSAERQGGGELLPSGQTRPPFRDYLALTVTHAELRELYNNEDANANGDLASKLSRACTSSWRRRPESNMSGRRTAQRASGVGGLHMLPTATGAISCSRPSWPGILHTRPRSLIRSFRFFPTPLQKMRSWSARNSSRRNSAAVLPDSTPIRRDKGCAEPQSRRSSPSPNPQIPKSLNPPKPLASSVANGNEQLQATSRVAERDGTGEPGLSSDSQLSQTRSIRPVIPTATRRSFRPRQHCGRSHADNQGVPSLRHDAHGSLAELETMFLAARDLQYIEADDFNQLADLCDATGRMLGALRRTLAKKLHSQKSHKRRSRNP